MTPRKTKRPPLKTTKDQVVRMRVPSEQRDRFKTAADTARLTLSDWLREAGEEKIERQKE